MSRVGTSASVTGIVIFLNAEEFFVEAIESVLRQTFAEWELVLVDDGSTDASTEMARHYAKEFAGRIRYLEHPRHSNLGMSASRNLGIRAAKSEFIAFLDADDVWLPHKLEEQVAILRKETRASMCFGPTLVWHDWPGSTDTSSHDWYTTHGSRLDTLIQPPEMLVQLLIDEWTVPCIGSVLVRRSAINAVGCFEEEFRGQMEDMVFHTKMFLHETIYVSSRCWAKYRQHQHNSGKVAMATGEWLPHQLNPARFAYLSWVEKYFKQEGISDAELQRVLNTELRPYRHIENVLER